LQVVLLSSIHRNEDGSATRHIKSKSQHDWSESFHVDVKDKDCCVITVEESYEHGSLRSTNLYTYEFGYSEAVFSIFDMSIHGIYVYKRCTSRCWRQLLNQDFVNDDKDFIDDI